MSNADNCLSIILGCIVYILKKEYHPKIKKREERRRWDETN
jgi:hypothetical protein